jgi:DNA-binding MarR family transcriptional regulator
MSTPRLPPLPCLCATLRRATRALTQRYEEAMRPLDLTSSQFTILQALTRTGEITQGRLGEILSMYSTTLTRTLAIKRRNGGVAARAGADRRERRLRLSKSGQSEFARALPLWEQAQTSVRTQLGEKRWNNLMNLINEVTTTVTE